MGLMSKVKPRRNVYISHTVVMLLLAGCGDSSEPKEIEVQEVLEPTPEPISEANPLPPIKTNVETDISTLTVTNVSSDRDESGMLSIYYESSNADGYRVIFWASNNTLYDVETTTLSATFASSISSSGGHVVVEAYDELGNSKFSTPLKVEAL